MTNTLFDKLKAVTTGPSPRARHIEDMAQVWRYIYDVAHAVTPPDPEWTEDALLITDTYILTAGRPITASQIFYLANLFDAARLTAAYYVSGDNPWY